MTAFEQAFADIDEVRSRLAGRSYVCDRRLATVVFLATRIGKPVLVEGPAGVGKTELAKVLAEATDAPLIRLQCYEGLDEAKALYEWEYGKQMLYTQVLREKIGDLLAPASDLEQAAEILRDQDDVFFSESFLVERPILQALRAPVPPVLLIDEIDRADEEFEAFLLEVLSDFQVSIPEIGTIRATSTPLVVLTSNRSRELSEALKRRCLHLQIDYPDPETELEIVRLKAPGIREELAAQLVETIRRLRDLDLRKAPSIGETLDWAQALVVLGAEDLDRELIEQTLSVVVKYDRDAEKALRGLGISDDPDDHGHHHHHHGGDHHHHHHDDHEHAHEH